MTDQAWSGDRIAQQYRLEIQKNFEAENRESRAHDAACVERKKRRYPEDHAWWAALVGPDEARQAEQIDDSSRWKIYQGCGVSIADGLVRVTLPRLEVAPDLELIDMFRRASVARPPLTLEAEIVDGEARIVLQLTLACDWDDHRAHDPPLLLYPHVAWIRDQRSPTIESTAGCTCGWIGSPRATPELARDDAAIHENLHRTHHALRSRRPEPKIAPDQPGVAVAQLTDGEIDDLLAHYGSDDYLRGSGGGWKTRAALSELRDRRSAERRNG